MKNDRISVERLRSLLHYDPATGLLSWKFRPDALKVWNDSFADRPAGTSKKGYGQIVIMIDGRNAFFGAHRVAWALHHGEWPRLMLDHIDHDTLNNRITNLRLASPRENSSHKREIRGAVASKGVYWIGRLGKFAAQIKSAGVWHNLGLHDSQDAAASAYDSAAIRLHGPFALTNVSFQISAAREWVCAP